MKVGSLVICVSVNGYPYHIPTFTPPTLNNIYTVRAIFLGSVDKETLILLEEIFNYDPKFKGVGHEEWGYEIGDFRELQPPMTVSISEIIQEPEILIS